MPRKPARHPRVGSEVGMGAHVLPDEDPKAFSELKASLIEELSPQTALERIIANDIINVVWDLDRHRRLLAATIKTAFFEQAEGVLVDGKPGRPSPAFYRSDSRGAFIDRLRSSDDEKRSKAEAILDAKSVSKAEIAAAAFISRESPVAYHEARIADLERRRRHLMNEYVRLQEKRITRDAQTAVRLIETKSGEIA
jgi:hypothetical protein